MPKICQGNFYHLLFPQKLLFSYTWWHWVHIRGRHFQWWLKQRVQGISGSSFESCSGCSARPLCTPACQNPVPEPHWAPAFPPPESLRYHQQGKNKPIKHGSVKITVSGAENVLSFSFAGPLVPIATLVFNFYWLHRECEGNRGWLRYKDDAPGPCVGIGIIGILKALCHQKVPTFQWHEAIRVCERVCLYWGVVLFSTQQCTPPRSNISFKSNLPEWNKICMMGEHRWALLMYSN